MQNHKKKIIYLVISITILFFGVGLIALYVGQNYIHNQLLDANKNLAMDFSKIVTNNFHVTDDEVSYMKSLSFNEMEADPINKRLMDIGDNVDLSADIVNVYVISGLEKNEIKYTIDEKSAEFFGEEEGIKLDGIWLFNGKIDENGHFVITQRDDIYRYTVLTESLKQHLQTKQSFYEYSADSWGDFISGYTPLYSSEGHFVGLLGIDMSPGQYQKSVQNMVNVLTVSFIALSLFVVFLFLFFYYKYIRAKQGQLYFDFYSRMSHDMRTPMNGILGMTALSKDETNIDTLHHNIHAIDEAGHYMIGLINDTLDIQKLDAGKMRLDYKTRDFSEIINNLIEMTALTAKNQNIQFESHFNHPNEDVYCEVDELRLRQIIINVISNAMKFTKDQVEFVVDCQEHDQFIDTTFVIRDNGIGMSEKFIKNHLFKPFEQEQNSSITQYGGSGLGLSIVKNLVDLMNGTIRVESQQQQGTTFTIVLRFNKCQEEEHKEMNTLQFLLKGKCILLCEDNHLNVEITKRLLEKEGMIVYVAHNGQEGVDMVESHEEIDAILMDIRMPIMDGIQATKMIRALNQANAKTVPIIAMTANAYDDDKKQCADAGMNGHISKPVEPSILYSTLMKKMKS